MSRGRLERPSDLLDPLCLSGGKPSSGCLGEGAGDFGDFVFMDTRRNAEGDTSGPLVGVAGLLRGVELP